MAGRDLFAEEKPKGRNLFAGQPQETPAPTIKPQQQAAPEQPKDINALLDMAKGATRGGLTGFASLPLMAMDAAAYFPRKVYESVTDEKVPSYSDMFQTGLSEIGFQNPETSAGRITGDVVGGVTGALGGVGAGRSLIKSASPRIAAIGNLLSAAPKSQAIAGASSGLAAGSTREMGGSPTAQLLAGLAGGIAPTSLGGIWAGTKWAATPVGNRLRPAKAALKTIKETTGITPDQLLNIKKSGIPGYEYTLPEAMQNPAMAMMQRAVNAKDPMKYSDLTMQRADDALSQLLDKLSGGKRFDDVGTDYAKALATRQSITDPAYAAALAGDHSFGGDLGEILATPTGQQVLAKATERLGNQFKKNIKQGSPAKPAVYDASGAMISPPTPATPTTISGEGVQAFKQYLSERLKPNATGMASAEADDARAILGRLNEWIATNVPEYKNVDKLYANLSRAPNEMDIFEALRQKIIPPIRDVATMGAQSTARFRQGGMAEAQRDMDKLARTATGFQGAKAERILSDEGNKMLKEINDAIVRRNNALSANMPVNSPTANVAEAGKYIAGNVAKAIPGGELVQKILTGINAGGENAINSELARMFADPEYAALIAQKYPQIAEYYFNKGAVFPALMGSQNAQNQ